MRDTASSGTPDHTAPPPARAASAPPERRPPSPAVTGARTLLFTLLLLFLNLQADGLPLGHGRALQLRLLPFTALFCAGLLALLFPFRLEARLPPRLLRAFASWQTLVAVIAVFLLLAAALIFAEARVYARFGYHLHTRTLGAMVLLSLLALRSVLRPPASAARLLAVLLAAYTALELFFLWSFPLAIERSDMLPLLAAANRTLLQHHSPYRLYTFATESVVLTYLPGTLLAYLPATLLHLDLRLTNLAATLLLALLLFRATRPEHRLRASALLGLFLLGPYLLYRHELYTPPHWLALTAALLLAQQQRLRAAALLFGLSIAMSQFSWILLPFFLLFLLQAHGRHRAAEGLALALLTAALIVLPFVAADPPAFLLGVFSHWGAIGLTARPVNLSFFTAALIGPRHLQLAQMAALALLFVTALRTKACCTFAGTLRVMVLALAAFTLLNLLIWGYFFLLLELLLLLYLLAADDALRPPSPPSSHRRTAPNL